MPNFAFHNVGISGVSAAVPKKRIKNASLSRIFKKAAVEKIISVTGIEERRSAGKNTCSSDLCFAAAERLILEAGIEKDAIDVLIFVSQTPDYRQPSTAAILQDRLGLKKGTASLDMNLACSGYVYGLSAAFSYASNLKENAKVLLLAGETFSKIVSSKDKATALLFGDAGSATLVERGDFGKSYFSLNSDGSGENIIKIDSGGYRRMSRHRSLMPRKRPNGSVRSDEQLFMDGAEVFNFTLREIPRDILSLLRYANVPGGKIDYFILHQANKLILELLAKKIGCPAAKLPLSLKKFGNTGSASIPLTLVSELKDTLGRKKKKVLLSGFGGGLSWASCVTDIGRCPVCCVIEV
ncbi:MAG: ketoacyl-ACP synthase III [Candidatus Omnitrophica bacterium]|nr:ketoacyl-ACP synthase III [Candidatus Omnitrophota bacterium]